MQNSNKWTKPSNYAFYARSASELFGACAQPIAFVPELGWHASNPSIYWGLGQLRCIVRTVNYQVVGGNYVTLAGDGMIRTRNFLLDLNDDLRTTRTTEMMDKAKVPRTSFPIHGFEDARLFAWRGTWWATATVCDFTDGRREIALLKLDDEGAIVHAEPLRGSWSTRAQKNWMPLVDGDVLRFVYATSPTTIFDLVAVSEEETGESCRYIAQCPVGIPLDHGRLRGGSQAVRIDGGWILVVHDVAFPGGKRFYLHRFVQLNDDLGLVAMTDPFYFEERGIEFCAGLTMLNRKLIASYAVNDGSAQLGIFDWDTVRAALRTDFTI